MNRDEALAICFANLKGTHDKDLLATARALRYLRSLPDHGSNRAVGATVGVSAEIVREFLSLLKLPEEVQRLLETEHMKLEHGRRLAQLARRRPDIVTDVARELASMTALDARDLVDFILRHPELSLAEAKSTVAGAKTVIRREFHVVAELPEAAYRQLVARARERNQSVNVLVTAVILEWLEGRQ